jgi:hypothetical protein
LRYSRSNNEYALATTEKQIAEYWTPSLVDTSNLPVENCAFNPKMLGDPRCKFREAMEDIAVS